MKKAYDNNLNINSFVLTRNFVDTYYQNDKEYYEEINNNKAKDDCLYVFWDYKLLNTKNDLFYYYIDNVLVGTTKEIRNLSKYRWNIQDGFPINLEKIGAVSFDLPETIIEYTCVEEGETKLNVRGHFLTFGPYINLNKGEYYLKIYGQNVQDMELKLSSTNTVLDYEVKDVITMNEYYVEYYLCLNESAEDVEFYLTNWSLENKIINKMVIQPK